MTVALGTLVVMLAWAGVSVVVAVPLARLADRLGIWDDADELAARHQARREPAADQERLTLEAWHRMPTGTGRGGWLS